MTKSAAGTLLMEGREEIEGIEGIEGITGRTPRGGSAQATTGRGGTTDLAAVAFATTATTATTMAYAELHAASAFSFLRAGSAVEALVDRAAELGLCALALCDFMTLAGVVRFQAACARRGLHGIIGCELAVADPVFGDRA